MTSELIQMHHIANYTALKLHLDLNKPYQETLFRGR